MAATTARRVRIAATASAVLLSGSLLGASAAEASTVAPPARPYGTVTAVSGLNVRQYPSTDSSVLYVLPYRAQRGLDCKVHAQNIQGNTLWYKLRYSQAWVSARFMHNTGYVPLCKDVHRTAATDSAKSKMAMG